MFQLALNIGTEGSPDFINVKCIKRAKQVQGTEQWKVAGKLIPEDDADWITISEDQYKLMCAMLLEHDMEEERGEGRYKETPTIRIVTE